MQQDTGTVTGGLRSAFGAALPRGFATGLRLLRPSAFVRTNARPLLFMALVTLLRAGIAARAGFVRLARRNLDGNAASTIFVSASVLGSATLAAFIAAVFLPDPSEGTPVAPPAPALAIAAPLASEPAVARPEPEGLRLAAVPAAWATVKRPIAIYHLESPETDRRSFRLGVETRGRHDRRDTLSWSPREGAAGQSGGASIQISIERFEAGAPTYRPLFPDLAQRVAAEGYAIERMTAPSRITTKFGAMEIADAILSAGDIRAACLLFRRIDGIGLTIVGWSCGSLQRPVDRVSLGCFLDRLDLIGAGRDVELKRLFAAAERNRAGCGQGRVGAHKQTWLDHEAPMPALKLSHRPK